MKQNISKFLFLLTAVLAVTVLNCGDDCPVCPGDNPPEVGQHYLITYSTAMRLLVSIDIPADTVIDTLSFDFDCLDGYLHPDNDKVMLLNITEGVMEIFSIPKLEYLGSSDQYGFYFFDIGDSYGLWYSTGDSTLYKIDNSTLLPVDTLDSIMIHSEAYLDTLNDVFYAGKYEDSGIFVIDCNEMSILDTLSTLMRAYKVLCNQKYNELYYIGIGGSFNRLDLTTRENTRETYLYTHFGSMAMSPDGEHVLVTHGGDGMRGNIPPPIIYDYIPSEKMLRTIPADPFAIYPGYGLPLLGNMAFTSDGSRVYVSSYHEYYGYVPIGVIDMNERRMTHTIDMPDNDYQYNNVILTR